MLGHLAMSGKKSRLRRRALAELLALRELDAEAFRVLVRIAREMAHSQVDTSR